MRTERLVFPGALGSKLAARLELPDTPPIAYALIAHCFTCSKDLKPIRRMSRTLAEEGMAALSFDFTGLGESEGEFADTSFSSNLDDLSAAAEFLRREYRTPEILVGHSLGGAAVLAAAHRIAGAKVVATIAAPSEPDSLLDSLGPAAREAEERGEAEVVVAGARFRIRRQLVEDLQAHKLRKRIRDLGRPLLILHSPADRVVPIEHARRIYDAARHPKSFVSLGGADHVLLEDPRDAEMVGRVLAGWARRYLPATGEPGGTPADQVQEGDLAPGEILVETGAAGYANEVRTQRHSLRADEPHDVGGTDTGPNPYEYLLAGLGACTSMTLRMYADRKGWSLEGVRVRLRHSRIHAEDCARCLSKEGMLDHIEREIELQGELSEEERGRLGEIADRCPVHRTLTSEIDITTRLVPPK